MKKLILLAAITLPLATMAQSNSSDGAIIGQIVIWSLGFLVMVAITRAVFMISTIVRNLKLQTELLILIASKDADEETKQLLKEIYRTREKYYYNKELTAKLK